MRFVLNALLVFTLFGFSACSKPNRWSTSLDEVQRARTYALEACKRGDFVTAAGVYIPASESFNAYELRMYTNEYIKASAYSGLAETVQESGGCGLSPDAAKQLLALAFRYHQDAEATLYDNFVKSVNYGSLAYLSGLLGLDKDTQDYFEKKRSIYFDLSNLE